MKRTIGLGLLFSLFFSLLSFPKFSDSALAEVKPPRKIVTGWLPYYSIDRVIPRVRKLPSAQPTILGKPAICDASQYGSVENQLIEDSYLFKVRDEFENKNKDSMKEIMPFWFSLRSPTTIRNSYVTGNPSWPMEDTICLLRRAGLQIIPTITDGTKKLVLSGYLSNATTRTTIVKTIVDLVMKNNFDGIDLDFEGFAFEDGNTSWKMTAPRWILFIKELSIALHANNKLLSVTTPYVYDPREKQKGYFVYAWADIASSIDRLRIMTYDYSVSRPGPNGPISWVDKTVKYAMSVMPSSKVYLGLPGYGRDWITKVTGKCPVSAPPNIKAGAKAATFLMEGAERKAVIDNAVPIFDEKTSEATYSYSQTYNGSTSTGAATTCTVNRTVWYQNERSYAERMALVAKYRLGGAALWTLAMESQAATDEMRKVALAIAPDPVVNTLTLEGLNEGSTFYGDLITIKGLVTLKDKTAIVGIPVSVELKRDAGWIKIAELISGVDGVVTTSLTLGSSAALRLTTVGTWERNESISNEQAIQIRSKVQLDRPVTVFRGAPIVVKVQLLPRIAGKSAFLQKFISGKWQNVGGAVFSDVDGLVMLSYTESSRGVVTLRVQVGSETTSDSFAIVVR